MKNFITIGTFDGVHKGHIKIFEALKKEARVAVMRPCILYFPLPPKTLLAPNGDMTVLTLPSEKACMLQGSGIKKISKLDFKKCQNISTEIFVEMLVSVYKMGGLLVGKDFALGKNREGHVDPLRRLCEARGVKFVVEDFFKEGEHKVSSSLIRQKLISGHIEEANALLGYKYFVSGKIIKGMQLGRKIGFPTANLDVGKYKILPQGIFAVEVILGKEKFKGVCNIGFRPTVNTIHANIPLVEVHILHFRRSIYGRKLTINFISKIRGEKKFDGLSSLTAQIKQDATDAEKLIRI